MTAPVTYAPARDANIVNLERQLSDALGLKVQLKDKGAKGGDILISYKSGGQLDGLCRKLGIA